MLSCMTLASALSVLILQSDVNRANDAITAQSYASTRNDIYIEEGELKASEIRIPPLQGMVVYYSRSFGKNTYIREDSAGGNSSYVCGYFEDGVVTEVPLPAPVSPGSVRRLFFNRQAAFVLAENMTETGSASFLYRIPAGGGAVQVRDGVVDAALADEELLLLCAGVDGVFVMFRDVKLPVSIENPASIETLGANGLAGVGNGTVSEIVDYVRGASLYVFSPELRPALPAEFNLLVEAWDEAIEDTRHNSENLVFYKIFLDGAEAGRTDTGLSILPRRSVYSCKAGEYHILRAERWKLDAESGVYRRENNIMQPDAVKFYLPLNRIIKLGIVRGAIKYRVSISTVME